VTTAIAPPDAAQQPRSRKRRAEPGLVGPLFRWELVRLARRGQDARARFILAVSLLFVLTVFTFAWFPHTSPSELLFGGTTQVLPLAESARFGEQFALTFLLAQLAVLVLLTPAYAAGGIAEEKEKKTFVFLLVSDLTSREILFGKFLGRLTFLLGVMLAGLPVLALTQFFGGMSLKFLLVSYLITATTVTMLAAVSAAGACATDTFRGALFRGYGLAALHVLVGCGLHPVLSPLGIIGVVLFNIEADSPKGFWFVGLSYAGSQLVIAAGAVWLGVRWVRQMRAKILGPDGRPPRDPRRLRDEPGVYRPRTRAIDPDRLRRSSPEPIILDGPADEVLLGAEHEVERNGEPVRVAAALPTARAVKVAPPRPRRRRPQYHPLPEDIANRPRVSDRDPFKWKEKYTTGTKRTADDDSIRGVLLAVGIGVGVTVGFFALIGLMALAVSGFSRNGTETAGWLMLISGVGTMLLYLLTVGSATAGSVVKERQRKTLESLLALPVDRRAILLPKWQVSMARGWWWGIPGQAALALAFLVSGAPASALPVVGYTAAAVPFTASLGLWLSVRCRTLTRAVLWLLLAIGGLVLVPVVGWKFATAEWHLEATAALALAAVGVAGAAWLFWQLAVREFEREGRN
jgi:ABC-type transport system involved in multi-copper enzyme maturation permease subunit